MWLWQVWRVVCKANESTVTHRIKTRTHRNTSSTQARLPMSYFFCVMFFLTSRLARPWDEEEVEEVVVEVVEESQTRI